MTRSRAKREIKNGKRVTHRLFDIGGWIEQSGGNIHDDGGFIISPDLFWDVVVGPEWAADWDVVKENQHKSASDSVVEVYEAARMSAQSVLYQANVSVIKT